MAKMRAVRVARAGGPPERVRHEILESAPDEVSVRADECGVCHSDNRTVEAQWPDFFFPRIRGHEIGGVIEASGAGVVGWRVDVGWLGGHYDLCEPRPHGWLIGSRNLRISGISHSGRYAEAMLLWPMRLVAIPDEFGTSKAAAVALRRGHGSRRTCADLLPNLAATSSSIFD
jgi:alcohol dehydrogenase